LSFQAPPAWPKFATRFLAGELPAVPELDTPALALRMLCDDIKALYGEAAQAEGPAPSAHQIDKWFWRRTVAGRLLVALRSVAMASENNALKTVGGRFFVPTYWLPWSGSAQEQRDTTYPVNRWLISAVIAWHGAGFYHPAPTTACFAAAAGVSELLMIDLKRPALEASRPDSTVSLTGSKPRIKNDETPRR
jgi:hypothetical protein